MKTIMCVSTALCMLAMPPKTDPAILKGDAQSLKPFYLYAAVTDPAPIYRYDTPLPYQFDDRWPSIRNEQHRGNWSYWQTRHDYRRQAERMEYDRWWREQNRAPQSAYDYRDQGRYDYRNYSRYR